MQMLTFEPLQPHHQRAVFDCGEESLNRYLRQYASQHQRKNIGRVYVAVASGDADGYGRVDGADFLVWQREFGSGSATANAGAVPEPAGALLVGVGVIGGALVGRRRGK